MTKLAACAAIGTLGLLAALDPPFTRADSRLPVPPVTVVRTVTVQSRSHGHSAGYWHMRNGQARRAAARLRVANGVQARMVARLRREERHRYSPTVRYAIALARAVYGVDQTRRTYCESTNNPLAVNKKSGAKGAIQFLDSTWATTPFRSFSPLDPVAAELAGGWMVAVAHRSSEWQCGL